MELRQRKYTQDVIKRHAFGGMNRSVTESQVEGEKKKGGFSTEMGLNRYQATSAGHTKDRITFTELRI